MMTMGELAEKAYKTAVEKGWYAVEDGKPTQRPIMSLICLFHSEVSEILEAYRDSTHNPDDIWFDSGKPEGMTVEVADLFIRIADAAGCMIALRARGFDNYFSQLPCDQLATDRVRNRDDFNYQKTFLDNFGFVIGEKSPSIEDMVFTSHKFLSSLLDHNGIVCYDYWAILQLLLIFWSVYCRHNNLPLEKAIELKMAYNATRPHRHGNKRL